MYSPPAPTTSSGTASILGRLALGRDEQAWRELLNRVGPDLHRLARRLAGDSALAEDAVQEALLQVRDHAGRFSPRSGDPDGDARRWLLRLTANTTLLLLRGRRRADARHHRAAREEPAMAVSAPGAALEQDETATLVRRALSQLNEPARTAVILHHCAGLGYEQVAAELRVPIGTAKTHVHRGLEKLRRHLLRLGCSLSLVALVGVLDGLAAAEAGAAGLGATHTALLTSPTKASLLALPTTGALSMTLIATGAIAAAIATAITIGSVRGADTPPALTDQAPAVAAAPANPWAKPLSQKCTLDFQDTQMVDALAFITSISKMNIVIDPTIVAAAPPVTLKVDKMELRSVLALLAQLTNTTFTIEHGALYCKTRRENEKGFDEAVPAAVAPAPTAIDPILDRQITFEFEDTTLADCLDFLRQITGAKLEARPGVTGDLTLHLIDVPVRDALYWFGKLSNTAFTVEGSTIVAAPAPAGQGGFDPRDRAKVF